MCHKERLIAGSRMRMIATFLKHMAGSRGEHLGCDSIELQSQVEVLGASSSGASANVGGFLQRHSAEAGSLVT